MEQSFVSLKILGGHFICFVSFKVFLFNSEVFFHCEFRSQNFRSQDQLDNSQISFLFRMFHQIYENLIFSQIKYQIIFFNDLFILCILVFCLHVCMHTVYVPCAFGGQKKVTGTPRTRVTNCCRYWELNLDPVRAASALSPPLNTMDLDSFPGGLHYVVGFSFTAATLSYAYGFRLTLTVFSQVLTNFSEHLGLLWAHQLCVLFSRHICGVNMFERKIALWLQVFLKM